MKSNKKSDGTNKGPDGYDIIEEEDPLTADYVQCNYCSRKFAQHVAERHIPRCKDILNRPKPP